jgi:hypothetical protein
MNKQNINMTTGTRPSTLPSIKNDIHDLDAAKRRNASVYELRQFGQTLDLSADLHEITKQFNKLFEGDILIYNYVGGTKRVIKSRRKGKEV